MALATAVAAGTLASAAYLNGKFHIQKDVSTIIRLKRAEREHNRRVAADRVNLWYVFDERCHERWNHRAIWTRERSYTFGEMYEHAVRYAQWLLDEGIGFQELVGMYLINSAEFIFIWFASLCIGAAPAFLNYNLEGKALLHCLQVCETRMLIVDQDPACQKRVDASRSPIESKGTKIVVLDDALKRKIASYPIKCPPDSHRNGTKGEFPYCLIYTSGTTGLPKGCAFTQSRLHLIGGYQKPYFDGKPGRDSWYNSMPLYHGTGAITSSGSLLGGVGIALAPKFSVSRFWPDIHDSGATLFIYVGETARYLLNAPPHPLERKHNLRLCYGNGLRPDVWTKVQQRFNIPEVAEFFNSTEGMFGMVNWSRGPFLDHCVGHHGLIFRALLHNVYIPVQIDHETGDIWRDPQTGLARRTSYEEGGEIIVAVPNKEAFQGYWQNDAATEKKFARDVFKKGDIYYRCGDALRRDSDGKWFFLDRLGDTFRWKSENVSTAEVSLCLGHHPGVAEANVYGVLVPNHEGRAGCAALHLEPAAEKGFDYDGLLQYLRQALPRYAIPVFLRVVKASTHIHNHKQNKVPLRKEGADPGLIGTEAPEGKNDIFMWLKPGASGYVPLTKEDWETLQAGKTRL